MFSRVLKTAFALGRNLYALSRKRTGDRSEIVRQEKDNNAA